MAVEIQSGPELAVDMLAWQTGSGARYRTVVAKATFELRRDGLAELIAPRPLGGDEPRPGDEQGSLYRATDFVPYKPRADVVMVGSAWAPGGRASPATVVALSLARGAEILLAKQLCVLGARASDEGAPKAFRQLSLHECEGDGQTGRLIDPRGSTDLATFGPQRPGSPARASSLGAVRPVTLEADPLVLPDELELAFFNSAPLDQQVPFLLGGEQLLLVGTDRDRAEIRCRFPALQAHGSLRIGDGRPTPVAMRCDTLWIDSDRMVATLTWRGHFAVEEALDQAELPGQLWVGLTPVRELEEVTGEPTVWRLQARARRRAAAEREGEGAREGVAGRRGAPPLANRSGLSATSFAWRFDSARHHRVVVAKGAFALEAGAAATPTAEPPPLGGDQHFDDESTASLERPSDFAPYKPRADVLLVGRAHAAPGKSFAMVTLSLGQDLRKQVVAIGDRTWKSSSQMSDPLPFESLPLRYEVAYGGPSFGANPVGMGAAAEEAHLPGLELPNRLIRTRSDAPPPACFAPIAPSWRARADVGGTYDEKWRRDHWPYLPADANLAHFNAAPVDQQGDFLRGDEPYELSSAQPGGGKLEGFLPGVRPRAFALRRTAGAEGCDEIVSLELRLDTVLFDTEARQVLLTWRGTLEVADPEASDIERILLTSERGEGSASVEGAWASLLAAGDERFAPAVSPGAGSAVTASDRRPALPSTVAELDGIRGAPAGAATTTGFAVAAAAPRAAPPVPPLVSREEIERLLQSGQTLAGRDWTCADLSGLDLSRRDLTRTILKEADLRDARFDEAKCAGLCLAGTRAKGSSWVGADLSGMDGAKADLREADLSRALLERANLAEARLQGCSLEDSQAAGASLVGARLDGGRLTRADLTKADLSSASLSDANLSRATLDDAKLYEARGERVVVDEASLVDSRLELASLAGVSARKIKGKGSNWERADLRKADLQGAELEGAGFVGADLAGASLNEANAKGGRFRQTRLEGAKLLRTNLMQATFENALLGKADLRGANLYQAETLEADLTETRLDGALLAGTKLST